MEELNVTGISENISDTIDKAILEKESTLPEHTLFKNLKIGISISDSPDMERLGYSSMHLQDASIEFARYLLVHGATMVYGGDLRKDGFTSLFSELAKLYTTKERNEEFRFKNYFAWPIHLKLTRIDEMNFKQNRVEIEKLAPPVSVRVNSTEFLDWDTNDAKVIWAKSLTHMREQMNLNCDARIFLGGQTQHFKGKYPGIIEEAYFSLKDNKPVYFIGGYGGAVKEIVNLINNEPSQILNDDYQFTDKPYKEFYDHWNTTEENKINYTELSEFFKGFNIKKIAKANGLTEKDNVKLFTTTNLTEMIFYVLKGLNSIQN